MNYQKIEKGQVLIWQRRSQRTRVRVVEKTGQKVTIRVLDGVKKDVLRSVLSAYLEQESGYQEYIRGKYYDK